MARINVTKFFTTLYVLAAWLMSGIFAQNLFDEEYAVTGVTEGPSGGSTTYVFYLLIIYDKTNMIGWKLTRHHAEQRRKYISICAYMTVFHCDVATKSVPSRCCIHIMCHSYNVPFLYMFFIKGLLLI